MKRGLTRESVRTWLQRHYWLRVHMFLIVSATFLAGLAATKLLLLAHVDRLALRYGLAVCAAYLAFLFLIRVWLWYVSVGGGDAIDFSADGIEAIGDVTEFGGGGQFGGGGATGSWSDGSVVPAKVSSGSSGSSGGGWSFDLDGDGGCLIVLALALVAALFFAGIYLVYTAPATLSEAAFEALLAAALARRARKIAATGWIGSVARATIWIFLAVLAFSVTLGWYAQRHCPEARRLRDAIECRP